MAKRCLHTERHMKRNIICFRRQTRSVIIDIFGEDTYYNVSHTISIKRFKEYFDKKDIDEVYIYINGGVIGRNTKHIKPEVLEMLAALIKRKT